MEFRAVHKKETGVAKLTEVGLEWTNGTGAPEHIPWATVTNHQYSPASHAKAMMKLTRASASAGAFVLEILGEPGGATAREVLERARDRVNALRERLSQRRASLDALELPNGQEDDSEDDGSESD